MVTTKEQKNKNSFSLTWRILLNLSIIGIFFCLLILFSLMPFQYNKFEKDAITEAKILSEAVSSIYQNLDTHHPHEQARRWLLRVARMPHIYAVNIIDKEGSIKYSTDSRDLGRKIPQMAGVVREEEFIIVSHLVGNPKSNISSVSVIIDRESIMADVYKLLVQSCTALFVVMFLIVVLLKGLLETYVVVRLERIIQLIENAKQGYFLSRVDEKINDEITAVSEGFNHFQELLTQAEAVYMETEHDKEDAVAQKNIRMRLEDTFEKLKRTNEVLERKVQAQDLLTEASHRLGGTLKREKVVERLMELIQEKLKWPQFAVFLGGSENKDKQDYFLSAGIGFQEGFKKESRVKPGEGVLGMVAQTGAPLIIYDFETDSSVKAWEEQQKSLFLSETAKPGSLMVIPMNNKGDVVGLMAFLNKKTNAFDSEDANLMCALGAQAALAISNANLYETTLELATVDPLTSVLNRRAMVKNIDYEIARAQRFKTKAALLLVDVDNFKMYNDRMGHIWGDRVLKEISSTLKSGLRKLDSVARFGGEEFCIILPQADITSAQKVAAKLCAQVRAINFSGVDKQPLGHLSISIGIAILPDDIDDIHSPSAINDIISAADKALYEAKRSGRDKFVVATNS